MTDVILDVREITKRFAGHTAVDRLSLAVPAGAIYGLLGPNGAGKTTTIRMIMRILLPDEGTISLFGGPANQDHSSRLGYLPEERGLYKKMRVIDLLVFLAEAKGIGRRTAKSKALDWLERLGLEEWTMRKIEELSKLRPERVRQAGAQMSLGEQAGRFHRRRLRSGDQQSEAAAREAGDRPGRFPRSAIDDHEVGREVRKLCRYPPHERDRIVA